MAFHSFLVDPRVDGYAISAKETSSSHIWERFEL